MFKCARALVWQNLVVFGDGHAGMPRHSGIHELGFVHGMPKAQILYQNTALYGILK
jgi:hypothetical protein